MNKIYIDKLAEKHNKLDIVDSLIDSDSSISVEFIYQSKFENTKDLRDFVDIICDKLGFSDKQKGRFILIADELNNNSIEYGSAAESSNIMRIESHMEESERFFNLEVEDMGDGKHPKTALDMETMRAHKLKLGYFGHNSIRGRGLFLIIVKLVDRLYFKNSVNGGLIVGIKTKI